MKCPNCLKGKIFPAIPHKSFPIEGMYCDICNGTNILPSHIKYDPILGDIWKGSRISKGFTLREQSKQLKINVIKLSKMERGYFYDEGMTISWEDK